MTLLDDAIQDNVAWCALVSGGPGTVDPRGWWLSPDRPPPLFPDLVTVRPGADPDEVAAALADRPSCSVKDSYADVDLTTAGFRVLIDATWIGRAVDDRAVENRNVEGPEACAPEWVVVDTFPGLVAWCVAAGLPAPLPAHLVGAPTVTVLGSTDRRWDDARPPAGAVVHRRGSTVGLSNVYGADPWPALLRAVPSSDVVGYEHGADLTAAVRAGMTPLGSLRVWVR